MKRIIASLLVLILTCSLFVTIYSDDAGTALYDDEVYGVLHALGILNSTEWVSDSAVTRAEFIQSCVNLVGASTVNAINESPVFTDVTEAHWAYNAILYAYNMGYIRPNQSGAFEPDSVISYAETVEILVHFLGFDKIIRSGKNGVALPDYMQLATEIGVTKNIAGVKFDRPISRRAVLQLLYNALFVDRPIMWESGNYTYGQTQEDNTILRSVYKAYRSSGVVLADDYAALSLDLARENYVNIDGEFYFTGNINIDGMLGCKVIYLYTVDDTTNTKSLLYIAPHGNEIVTIRAEDCGGYEMGAVTAYNEKGRKISYRINHETTVMYNSRVIKSKEYQDCFSIDAGRIQLIDNDLDGIYEAVIIEEAKYYKVDVLDSAQNLIRTSSGATFPVNDYKSVLIKNAEGERVDLYTIFSNNIIAVYEAGSKAYSIKIELCSLEETADVVSVDSAEKTIVTSSGKVMRFSDAAISSLDELRLGDTYQFRLDKDQKIIYAEALVSNSLRVAYLMDYGVDYGLDERLKLKVLNMNGNQEILDCAKKIRVRDKEGNFLQLNAGEARAKLNWDGTKKRQPIMIKLNYLNCVSEIYLLANVGRFDLTFHEIPHSKVGSPGLRWYSSAYTFHNVMQLSSATKVIAVPHADAVNVSDDAFMITNVARFVGGIYYKEGGVDGYNAIPIGMEQGALVADYFVWECPTGDVDKVGYARGKHGIVTQIAKLLDEEGKEYAHITYCTPQGAMGNSLIYKFDGVGNEVLDVKGNLIEVGDVVGFGLDMDDYAHRSTTTLFYDCSKDEILNESISTNYVFYDGMRIARCKVTKKHENSILIDGTRIYGGTYQQVLDISSVCHLDYTKRTGRFELIKNTSSLIMEADELILIVSGGLPRLVLDYK